MEKAQGILQKYFKTIAFAGVGLYVAYLLYLLFDAYGRADGFLSFLLKIWSYPVYSVGDVSITLNKIVLGFIIVFVGIFISKVVARKWIHSAFEKTSLSKDSKAVIENVIFYSMVFLFVVIALAVVQVPLTAFTVFGGAIAIGVGFGSQNLLNNFISGLILQIEKPMKVGDLIELDEFTKGTVEDIGPRSTKISVGDGSFVILPNSVFLERRFVNMTLKNYVLRSRINFALPYKHDPEEIINIVETILKEFEEILPAPAAKTLVVDLSEHGVKYSVLFFLSTSADKSGLESRVRMKLHKEFQKRGIFFAVPQREMIKPQE